MVLYTPLPLEIILKGSEEKKGHYLQIPYQGGTLEVELISASRARIVRLYSNNINDYLHPGLQPGTEIQLQWRRN